MNKYRTIKYFSVIILLILNNFTYTYPQSKDIIKDSNYFTKEKIDTLQSDSSNNENLSQTEELINALADQKKIDSLLKAELLIEIQESAGDIQKRKQLEEKLKQKEIKDSITDAGQLKKLSELKKTSIGYVVKPFSDTIMVIYTRIGSSKPPERAEAISHRIKKLYEDDFFNKDSLKVVRSESNFDITYKDEIIVTVTRIDAQWLNIPEEKLADQYLVKIRDSVSHEKDEKSFSRRLKRILYAFLILFVVIFLMYLINRLFRKTAELITESKSKYINGLKLKNLNILNPDQHKRFLLKLNNILKLVIKLAALYFTLPVLFSIFPSTKGYADTLLSWVLTPARGIFDGIYNFLPDLVTIIVIFIFTHYFIKALKFFADEIDAGEVSIGGFYKDWTKPTFNILKFILYAFMLVLIFPYLPGSNSDAFKGISVFIGVLLSFGSTSAITNVVAGLVITYMRPFQIGDMIKIGDVSGVVTEKTMLVTRIKTIKNEDISVPNSTVLSSHTINYSAHAKDPGLILHTTVTIGYDVPWKEMHEALINAALRTELILKEPKPYVHQTSLDDFYVSYQINAYTHDANNQAHIYSRLHENIQDCCNEAGIEIMSPHYRNLRDGNMTTIPEDYLAKNYVPPVFTVKNIEDDKSDARREM